MSSVTIIDIPLFIPQYESDKSYGYKGTNRERLLELLYKTTKGYCMYCYSRIEVDSKRFGHLEHAIEEIFCEKKLSECVPNIGLACPKCNQSFKNSGLVKGDKNNIVKGVFTHKQIENFENIVCSNSNKCTRECSAYKIIKRAYMKKRKIILQPSGVEVKGHTYKIQYNLLTLAFEPSNTVDYTDDEKEFIREHILRFNLNDSVYRTREILVFCEDIISGDRYLRKGKYNNYIVDLFIDKLENLNEEAKIKLCSTIYTLGKNKRII
jgi:hypothetical protein